MSEEQVGQADVSGADGKTIKCFCVDVNHYFCSSTWEREEVLSYVAIGVYPERLRSQIKATVSHD